MTAFFARGGVMGALGEEGRVEGGWPLGAMWAISREAGASRPLVASTH